MKKTVGLLSLLLVSVVHAGQEYNPLLAKHTTEIPCRGPVAQNSTMMAGAPRLKILKQLVPAGPMLPAFNHVYFLEVMNLKPNAPRTILELHEVGHSNTRVHTYQAQYANGSKSHYQVLHNIVTNEFKVNVSGGNFYYLCGSNSF